MAGRARARRADPPPAPGPSCRPAAGSTVTERRRDRDPRRGVRTRGGPAARTRPRLDVLATSSGTARSTTLAGEARMIAFDLRGHGAQRLRAHPRLLDRGLRRRSRGRPRRPPRRRASGRSWRGHSMGAMTIARLGPAPSRARVQARARRVAMIGTGLGDLTSEALVVRAPRRSRGPGAASTVLLSTEIPFDGAPEPVVRAAVRFVAFGPDARGEDVALVAPWSATARGGCGGSAAARSRPWMSTTAWGTWMCPRR